MSRFASLQGLGPTRGWSRRRLSQDVMVLAFVPLFANPQGVAQPPLQSTYTHSIRFKNIISNNR
ncbi:hypothetical protein [Lysinibacillus sp. CTST325]